MEIECGKPDIAPQEKEIDYGKSKPRMETTMA